MDQASFKKGMAQWCTGVSIITTQNGGKPVGFTATSFTSVSLDPPLVLFCLAQTAQSFKAFESCATFGVNVLQSNQEPLSNLFASKEEDKFLGLERISSADEPPLLAGCLVNLICRTREAIPGGDHSIFLGEVTRVITGEGDPLLYFMGGYHQL